MVMNFLRSKCRTFLGTLTYTQGALYAFESACKAGQYDLVQFIFQEADYQQRVIILGAEECRAFRLAAEGGHLDVLRLFLEKSTRMNQKRNLLEAENCYAFRRALVNGHEAVVELIWASAETDEDRRVLLNAALFSSDMKEIAANSIGSTTTNRIVNFLWKNSPPDLRSALFTQYLAPRVATKFYSVYQNPDVSSTSSPDASTVGVAVALNDLSKTVESSFFDICYIEDLEDVQKYIENKLNFEYGRRWDSGAQKLESGRDTGEDTE